MIDEAQGRQILFEAFTEAGFKIEEDFSFPIAGTVVYLDGYDPGRRVGYEYVTTAAGDRANISERVLEELEQLNAENLVSVLLIDEHFISTAEELLFACRGYLEELALGG